MADNEGFNGDPLAEGSYSELLFADDIVSLENRDGIVGASSVSNEKTPKMLCFGDYQNEYDLVLPQIATQKAGATCTESSSKSSANNGKTRKKRNGCVDGPGRSLSAGAGTPAGSQRSVKKIKSEKSAGNGHAKVRKETLGERISALQKLVSPFGKTDTASVLHEATGYIKFLHDQVKVLCSPYLQPLGTSTQAQLQEGGETGEDRSGKDLRSRGLCLVPVDSTLLVANSNGADFWSPAAAMGNNVSSDRH